MFKILPLASTYQFWISSRRSGSHLSITLTGFFMFQSAIKVDRPSALVGQPLQWARPTPPSFLDNTKTHPPPYLTLRFSLSGYQCCCCIANRGREGSTRRSGQKPMGAGEDKVFTLAEVSQHSSAKDCWLIIGGKVTFLSSNIPTFFFLPIISLRHSGSYGLQPDMPNLWLDNVSR